MLEKMEKGIGVIEKLQKLGIPFSQIILLCGAGIAYWYQWDWIKTHWLWTLLIIALYEFLVFVLILGKAILRFIGELWKEEFKKDALKVTATWLRAIPSNFSLGFLGRYNRQLIIDHEVFNVRGLGLISTFTLKLDQVFVDLKMSPSSNPNKFNPDLVAAKEFAKARSIWDFIRASKDQSGDAIALSIVGPPGCGKTTLLQHVTITLASNKQRRFGLPAYIPILLFLRNHLSTIIDKPSVTLGEVAHKYFSSNRYPELHPQPNWFERQLRNGKCLVLLDGLDEVAQADSRQIISRWVDHQLRNYPRCRFVITSRPQGYQNAPLERANVVEVQPFSQNQVKNFIQNWYLANEVVSAGNIIDQGVRQRAKRESDDLLKRLRNPKAVAINELTVNPLLLTMIAMVHRYRGALPGSRVELYREICEVLLGRWRQSKGVQDDPLTADQKRLVLMPLAARMMELEIREIPTGDALEVIRGPLQRVGMNEDVAGSFLNGLQASSGLLLERENGRWSFAHLTFQEYLTAAYWLSEKNTPSNCFKLVNVSWWHETLRLYAAQGDATPILQACLSANTVTSLTLAAEIMEEGAREIVEGVRNAVEDRITASLESTNSTLSHLAAEVLLSRRVSLARSNSMLRIDEKREIDTTHITCAEYQLFLDEMRKEGEFLQPDHWMGYHFMKGQAAMPIRGVRFEDARTFCEWLTKRQVGGVKYRLPTTDEANLNFKLLTETGVWCQEQKIIMSDAREYELRRQLLQTSGTPLPLRSVNLSPDVVTATGDWIAQFEQNINSRNKKNAVSSFKRKHRLKIERSNAYYIARNLASYITKFHLDDSIRPIKDALFSGSSRLNEVTIASASDLSHELIKTQESEHLPTDIPKILYDLLCIAAAQTVPELQLAKHRYAANVSLFACRSLFGNNQERRDLWLQLWQAPSFDYLTHSLRWRFRRVSPARTDKQTIVDLHWWLQIVMARQEGRLPAWEGIMVVRERPHEK